MAGILEILCGIIMLMIALRYYYTSTYDFWKKRGVPGPKATLFFGNVKDILLRRTTMMKYWKEVYDMYKGAPLVGIFYRSMPMLIVNDPELIKDVMSRDAMVFGSRGLPYSRKGDPLTLHIFRLEGEIPLYLRTKMSPVFTSSKIKRMFPLLLQRLEDFNDWLDTLLLQNEQIDCTELMDNLAADLGSVYIFGYDIKSIGDGNNEIVHYTKGLNRATWKNNMKELLMQVAAQLYGLIGYNLFHNEKPLKFYTCFVNDIAEYRKKYGIVKHDIASVLMELQQNPGKLIEKFGVVDDIIIANYYALFVAVFESSGATMTNILYELALNQTIQDKLREEIHGLYAENNEKISFDNLMAMPYLDAVFKEALRKYPVADVIPRKSLSAYTFRKCEVVIPKDQLVVIPVYAIHHDPEIYPKPEIFDPERFLNQAAPSEQSVFYLPFGYGLRNCIGERFGILQTKLGIINFFRNYKVDICGKTAYEYSTQLFIQQPKEIRLKIIKIN